MSPPPRVIALGQAAAGDDGVAFAVLDALRRRSPPARVELLECADPSQLFPWLSTPAPVVLLDAALGEAPGRVLVLAAGEAWPDVRTVSSHGLDLRQVVALAGALWPAGTSPSIHLVAVTIHRPERLRHGLSVPVAAAVERAADRVLALVGRSPSMHESSLARAILDAVLARARSSDARRIRRVRAWVADTEALAPESLGLHFAAHARSTLAEGAVLDLRVLRVEARCRGCARRYAPAHHLLLCPSCGGTDGELLGPTGAGVDAMEVD